ncbi:MAG: DUF4105 domain-containing protein [Bacteroidaceae bacterium]|nr:DUF4105 domain-containing protein [Bacteroidaceae bacterium]
MYKKIGYILLSICLLCTPLWMHATPAQQEGQNRQLEAYLVTCSPGTEAYEVYGHTALRIREMREGGADFVVNYGVFSFKEDNFLLRWLLGETDYSAEILPYGVFRQVYERGGRSIVEQQLQLTQPEVQRLATIVTVDVQAAHYEGWTYRYNFFYDNCTTRVIDAVEQALGDSVHVVWPEAQQQTLRQMLHQFAQPTSPWMSEGQDMLIGIEVDKPATMRQQLFSPIWASHYAAQAAIVRADGSRTPLVSGTAAALPDADVSNPLELPFSIAGLVLIAGAIFRRFRGGWWQMHVAVHTLQGLAGMVIAFLFVFSTHPAVDSNWLIVAFNPLWFVAAWYVWRHHGKTQGYAGWCYKGSIVMTIALLVAGKICGQCYPLSAVLLNIYLMFSLPLHDKTK